MVSDKILIRDKWKGLKKSVKIFLVILTIAVIISMFFLIGYFVRKPSGERIVLENPLKNIVFANTDEAGMVDKEAVIQQGILEFDIDYINYLLVALGINELHKSMIGYGNPKVELIIDEEIWNSEVIDGGLKTQQGEIEGEDIKVLISKREAVEGLLVQDIRNFMVNSVQSGRTEIEMTASKPELLSKGYLGMYTKLTGKEVE